jgi:hypothetical protein
MRLVSARLLALIPNHYVRSVILKGEIQVTEVFGEHEATHFGAVGF